eukprot:601525-Pleurochrysis_carterae.AAC.1
MMRSASHAHTFVRRMLTCMCTTCLCTRILRKRALFTTCANPSSPHAQRDAQHQFRRIRRVAA